MISSKLQLTNKGLVVYNAGLIGEGGCESVADIGKSVVHLNRFDHLRPMLVLKPESNLCMMQSFEGLFFIGLRSKQRRKIAQEVGLS